MLHWLLTVNQEFSNDEKSGHFFMCPVAKQVDGSPVYEWVKEQFSSKYEIIFQLFISTTLFCYV